MGASSVVWKSWLLSPHLTAWQKRALRELRRRVPRDRESVWILSSGTQSVGQVKAIALKREAILCSADGVNRFLGADRRDVWLLALPAYHIGGFAIGVRAALSGSRVVTLSGARWSAASYAQLARAERVTLSSLVPTQVHDLVACGLKAPASLRAIVVGGGALDPALYSRARALGWPVLPSYGMTETASQVATAKLESLQSAQYPGLSPLPHAEIELRGQQICIRSHSLCHWLATSDGERFTLEDPRRAGWLATADLGEWRDGGLHVLGRRDDVVKVLGVLVPLAQVQSDLGLEFKGTILAVPSDRQGHQLVAVTDTVESLSQTARLVEAYNSRVAGPFRVALIAWVPSLPLGDLGKVKKAELAARLGL